MSLVNLLVVDDHKIFRESIVSFLSTLKQKFNFLQASNGLEALDLLKSSAIDLVLLDVQMPKMNGIELLEKIKQDYSSVRVIMLTQFGEQPLIIRLVELGADAIVLKDASLEELELTLTLVLNGGKHYSDYVSQIISLKSPNEKETVAQLNISPREYQLAVLLMEGYDNKQIANHLGLSYRTIESYRKSLMAKTNCKNVAELIRLIQNTGLISKS